MLVESMGAACGPGLPHSSGCLISAQAGLWCGDSGSSGLCGALRTEWSRWQPAPLPAALIRPLIRPGGGSAHQSAALSLLPRGFCGRHVPCLSVTASVQVLPASQSSSREQDFLPLHESSRITASKSGRENCWLISLGNQLITIFPFSNITKPPLSERTFHAALSASPATCRMTSPRFCRTRHSNEQITCRHSGSSLPKDGWPVENKKHLTIAKNCALLRPAAIGGEPV